MNLIKNTLIIYHQNTLRFDYLIKHFVKIEKEFFRLGINWLTLALIFCTEKRRVSSFRWQNEMDDW